MQEPVSLESPVGDEESGKLGDFIADDDAVDPGDTAIRNAAYERLHSELETLNKREKQILQTRFGLIGDESQTLEDVGNEIGITRERVRQIEAKALRKLRRTSRKSKLFLPD